MGSECSFKEVMIDTLLAPPDCDASGLRRRKGLFSVASCPVRWRSNEYPRSQYESEKARIIRAFLVDRYLPRMGGHSCIFRGQYDVVSR